MVYKGDEDRYFEWLKTLVDNPKNPNLLLRNQKALFILYSRAFLVHPSVPMDKNRMYDGLELRERFVQETGRYKYRFDDECSVLEVIIALAIRCEETIMGDNVNDKSYKWFWKMINMMGIKDCQDSSYINRMIDNLINRDYDFDGGNGGLFHIDNPRKDLNRTELWYQMCWYLNNVL